MAFPFFVARCFEENWAIRLTLVHQDSELRTCRLFVADATFKECTLEQHSPALIDLDVVELGNQSSHGLNIAQFLFNFDCLDEKVFVEAGELETLHEYFSGLLLVPALLLHLGVLEPALVSVRLQVGHQLEEQLSFLEPGLSLGVVCEVEDDSPVDLAGDRENSLESFFNHILEAVLLLLFHFAADLLVLVLAVRSFYQVLLEPLNPFPRLELCEVLA